MSDNNLPISGLVESSPRTLIFTPDAGDIMTLTYLAATLVIANRVATVTTAIAHQLQVGDLVSLECTNTTGRLVKALVETVASRTEFTVALPAGWHPGADGPETGGAFGHYRYQMATFFGTKPDGDPNPSTIKIGRDPAGLLMPVFITPNDPLAPQPITDVAPPGQYHDLAAWYAYGVAGCSIVVFIY